jgi:AcrR family transcriptional regulator
MSEPTAKKLPRIERREQLLGTARTIIGEEGTEALTLGRLAARAGVSKPIAYEHFGTRAGLLIALCGDYDDRQAAARTQMIAEGETLFDVASIFASTYINCVMDIGPEMGPAFDALAASEETAAFRQQMREGYIAAYRNGFGSFVELSSPEGSAVLAGLLGAAEALAGDASAGRIERDAAIEALTQIFVAALQRFPSKG